MTQTDPQVQAYLDKLAPIITPPPVGIWPLAPGWWFLIVLALAALVALVITGVKVWRKRAYRREAQQSLRRLNNPIDQQYANEISALLKRVALTAYPEQREFIAPLTGKNWCRFISQTAPSIQFKHTQIAFTQAAYDPKVSVDQTQLKLEAENWIKAHKPARKLALGGEHV